MRQVGDKRFDDSRRRLKNPSRRMKRVLKILAILALLVSTATGCAKAPCDAPYSCPAPDTDAGTAVISCIPPADGTPECAGACYAWIVEHCPDVVFIY